MEGFEAGVYLILHSLIIFRLIVLKIKAVSCLTLIHASLFIAPKVYDALFIGTGAVSLIVILFFVVSPLRAFCLACSFSSKISSSVSIVSSGRKKSCSPSATSVDCRLTFIGLIVKSSLILSAI